MWQYAVDSYEYDIIFTTLFKSISKLNNVMICGQLKNKHKAELQYNQMYMLSFTLCLDGFCHTSAL